MKVWRETYHTAKCHKAAKKIKKKKKKKKSNGKKKSTFLKDLDGLKYRNLNKEFKSYKNK